MYICSDGPGTMVWSGKRNSQKKTSKEQPINVRRSLIYLVEAPAIWDNKKSINCSPSAMEMR
jgi:hypothetical protein